MGRRAGVSAQIDKPKTSNTMDKEIEQEERAIRLMLLRDIRDGDDRIDWFKAIERYDAFLTAIAKGAGYEGRSKCKG